MEIASRLTLGVAVACRLFETKAAGSPYLSGPPAPILSHSLSMNGCGNDATSKLA